jgi:hypothetical protein
MEGRAAGSTVASGYGVGSGVTKYLINPTEADDPDDRGGFSGRNTWG